MPAPSSIPSPPNQPNQPLATFNSVKEQLKSRTKRWESEAVLCNNKNEYLSKKLEYLQDVVDIQQRALDTLHIDAEKSSVLRQSIQLSQLEISSLLSVVNLDDARPSRQGVALDAAPPQPSSFQVRRPMTNDIYDNWNSPSPNNTYTPNTSTDRFQNRLGSLVPSEHIPLEIPNGYLDHQNGRRNNNTFSTQSKPTPGDDYYGTAFERVGSLGWSPVRSNASPLRPSISPTYPRISNTPHPQGNPIPIHRRWPTPNSRNSVGWDNTPSSPSINMRKPMLPSLTSSEDTFSDSSGQELSQALSISYRNGVAVDLEGLQDEIDALKYSNQPIPSSKVGEMLQKVLEVVQASNDDKKELERKLSKYKQRTKQLERHIIQQTYNDDHKGILNREPARPAYTISPSVNSRPSYTSLNNRRSPNSRESLGRASPRVSHRSPARRTAL